jgi:protein PhnA
MADGDDDYVYDEASGEWIPAAEAAAKKAAAEAAAGAVEVRDSVGNLLADGDSVLLVKDLKVKGANQTLSRGSVIKSIRLTGDPQEIDCRHETIKGLVLRAEFVRKR